MTGIVNILNVGQGDTTLSFDPNNPQERIRAARIVKDMIRRGYALLIEVEDGAVPGQKKLVRALDFDETKCAYIIADFDPLEAAKADQQQEQQESDHDQEQGAADAAQSEGRVIKAGKPDKRYQRKQVPAEQTKAKAVAPITGG